MITFFFLFIALTFIVLLRSTFEHISKSSEIVNQSISLDEARACHDLLSQAKYHLDRAKSREEQERLFRQRQVLIASTNHLLSSSVELSNRCWMHDGRKRNARHRKGNRQNFRQRRRLCVWSASADWKKNVGSS